VTERFTWHAQIDKYRAIFETLPGTWGPSPDALGAPTGLEAARGEELRMAGHSDAPVSGGH
jgi:hypothetical protein